MKIFKMAVMAALSVLVIASCGHRTGKKNASEPAVEIPKVYATTEN